MGDSITSAHYPTDGGMRMVRPIQRFRIIKPSEHRVSERTGLSKTTTVKEANLRFTWGMTTVTPHQ